MNSRRRMYPQCSVKDLVSGQASTPKRARCELRQRSLAQQASPCHPDDIGITVCPSGKVELRVIRGTLSPKQRYGVAWNTEEARTGHDYQLFSGEAKTRYAAATPTRSWCA